MFWNKTLRVALSSIQISINHLVPNTQTSSSHSVSTIGHCYTLWASVVSLGEDGVISLGVHGKNGESNLIGNAYGIRTSSFVTIPKNTSSHSPPMVISVKMCMVSYIYEKIYMYSFCFYGGGRKNLGTTCAKLTVSVLKPSRAFSRVNIQPKTNVSEIPSFSISRMGLNNGDRGRFLKRWLLIQYWHGWSFEKSLAYLFAVKAPNLTYGQCY
jgi:hypothetical protein